MKDQLCLSRSGCPEDRHRHAGRRDCRTAGSSGLVGQPERQRLVLPVPRLQEGDRGGRLAGRARSSASSTRWLRGSRTRSSRRWRTRYSRQAPTVVQPAPTTCRSCSARSNSIEARRSKTDPGKPGLPPATSSTGGRSAGTSTSGTTPSTSTTTCRRSRTCTCCSRTSGSSCATARGSTSSSRTPARGTSSRNSSSYLLARLLWNPGCRRAMRSVKEFLDGYYGAASPWIAKYIAGLAGCGWQKRGEAGYLRASCGSRRRTTCPAISVAQYNEWFDRAEAAVQSNPSTLERVKTARLPVQYATAGDRQERPVRAAGLLRQKAGRAFRAEAGDDAVARELLPGGLAATACAR